MTYKHPLATSAWTDAELGAMQAVIDKGMFTMGEQVAQFEKQFADYSGSKYCIMANSGSSANLLMVAAMFYTGNRNLQLQRGDEVIVPAVSWSTTYTPLHQYGLKLKFVDIDLDTLNYDLKQLASAISDKTRAIMAVNLLGNPNDFTAMQAIINGRRIVLLEDNCESMGAEFNGRKTGNFGVMGSFSTFFSHHMSTMEGGMVITDDEELYHIMLSLRSHGWTRHLPQENKVTGHKSDDPFEESFRFVLPGYNLRPLELSGAIGIEQLKKLPDIVEHRRNNGAQLQKLMANHEHLLIQQETGASSWFGFSLVIRPGSSLTRAELIQKLDAIGMESRPIVAGNFTRNPVVNYFDYTIHGQLSNADHVHDNGLFVGNQHYDLAQAIGKIASL